MNPDGSERYTTPLGMPVNIVRMTIELNQMSRGEREREREREKERNHSNCRRYRHTIVNNRWVNKRGRRRERENRMTVYHHDNDIFSVWTNIQHVKYQKVVQLAIIQFSGKHAAHAHFICIERVPRVSVGSSTSNNRHKILVSIKSFWWIASIGPPEHYTKRSPHTPLYNFNKCTSKSMNIYYSNVSSSSMSPGNGRWIHNTFFRSETC